MQYLCGVGRKGEGWGGDVSKSVEVRWNLVIGKIEKKREWNVEKKRGREEENEKGR